MSDTMSDINKVVHHSAAINERICEATEAMVEQYGTIIEMQRSIITELKKIVQGNAAIFEQIRVLRMMKEKQFTLDDKLYCSIPSGDDLDINKIYRRHICQKCNHVHSITSPCSKDTGSPL